MKLGYWTVDKIKSLGLELVQQDKLWCHFRGLGFDIHINLDVDQCKGTLFNFKSYKNSMRGNFKAVLNNEEEFIQLMTFIV